MIAASRSLFLILIAPAAIMLLWASAEPLFHGKGPVTGFLFLLAGPIAALAAGLTGIALADWRRTIKIVAAVIYIVASVAILPFGIYGALCLTRGCPVV